MPRDLLKYTLRKITIQIAKKMNILLVIDSLGSGGAQRQMALLADGLAERGHKVTLFVYFPGQNFNRNSLADGNVRIISAEKKSRFDPSPFLALFRDLRRHTYDVAVAFLPSPAIYLIAARGLRGRPPVIVSHRRTYENDLIPIVDRMKLAVYGAAHCIVANSHLGAEQIARTLPFLARKLRVVSNCVELSRFDPNSTGGEGETVTILFVGRLSPEKNLHRVLDAMALIKARGGKLPKLLWAGRYEGGEAANRYAAAVHERVEKYGLSENWEALGERHDIPKLLAKCDALLLASTFEGTPNAVCEGLAAGRPVLASRVGDVGHLVQDGVSGYLFDPASPEDIADKIAFFMLTDPAQRAAMGRAGRRFAEKTFSISAYIDSWETCIRAAVTSCLAEGTVPV